MTKEELKSDMVKAMKAGDKDRVQVLRMMISEVSYGETAKEPVSVLASLLLYRKKLSKAIADAHTDALAKEIEIVSEYIPREPTKQDLLRYAEENVLSGKPASDIKKAFDGHFPVLSGKLAFEVATQVSKS